MQNFLVTSTWEKYLFTKQERSLIFSALKKSSFLKWMLLLNFLRVQVKYPHSVSFFWICTISWKCVQIYFFPASANGAQTVLNIIYERKKKKKKFLIRWPWNILYLLNISMMLNKWIIPWFWVNVATKAQYFLAFLTNLFCFSQKARHEAGIFGRGGHQGH